MNDPGLDAPIQDAGEAVEHQDQEEEEIEEQQAFLDPRYITYFMVVRFSL